MATNTGSPAKNTTDNKKKKAPAPPVAPTTPPLIVRVGGTVIPALPAGCTPVPDSLLAETLIPAALLTRTPAPLDVTLAVEQQTAVRLVYGAMRGRQIHPYGDFDKQGRWYPTLAQNAGDMTVRSPSRYPYSYMTACRTLKHTRRVADTSPELLLTQLEEALRKRFPLSTELPPP
ncbi:hypothetical protein Q0M94_26640 (plasmid) [Deinococcus radiomollis]|uniref:hypothetical protein n=1 Tax=Deinococcus radiomollis TaxID=468916 RepID=UPI003892BC77